MSYKVDYQNAPTSAAGLALLPNFTNLCGPCVKKKKSAHSCFFLRLRSTLIIPVGKFSPHSSALIPLWSCFISLKCFWKQLCFFVYFFPFLRHCLDTGTLSKYRFGTRWNQSLVYSSLFHYTILTKGTFFQPLSDFCLFVFTPSDVLRHWTVCALSHRRI